MDILKESSSKNFRPLFRGTVPLMGHSLASALLGLVGQPKLQKYIQYIVDDNKLIRFTALANKEDKVLSKIVLLENLDYLKFSYSDDLSFFVNEWQSVQKNNTFPKFIIVEYSINDEIFKYTLSTFK